MNFEEIKSKIENETLWREECPGQLQLYHYIMECFVSIEPIVKKSALTFSLQIYNDGIVTELTPYKEKEQLFRELFEKVKEDKNYLENLISPLWNIDSALHSLFDEIIALDIQSISDPELSDLYKKFHKIMFDFVVYGTYWETVDPYSEKISELIKNKYNVDKKEISNLVVLLCTPKRRSFLTQEKIEFINLCLGKIPLDEFHSKYFWMNSNYKDVPEFTKEEIMDRVNLELEKNSREKLEEELKKTEEAEKFLLIEKQDAIEKYKIDEQDQILFSLIERFGELIDMRKEGMMKSNYAKYHLICEIAKRKNIPLEDLMFLTEEESIDLLNGKNFDKNQIKDRKELCVIFNTPDSEKLFTGKQAEELHDAYLKNILSHEFKGNVAYNPGTPVIGKVCKVLNSKAEIFEEGCILVTTMTRPDLLPMMRKAKAVITDEGGLTCHAAIVSRELKIPCIIGAKVATKLLKNGNKIKMNMETGEIVLIDS